MTVRRSTALPLLLVIALVSGCDYVSSPIVDGGGDPITGEGVTRKVLLEDFTGHRCNNCPGAAAIGLQLQDLYGEDLIMVGIHMTSTFAAPVSPPNADGSYSTDFRTEAGDAYETALDVAFLPNGAVSRRVYNNSLLQGEAAWGSAVADIIGEPADMDIWFSELTYNSAANTVSAEVKVAVLNPVDGDHNLTIYLIEDHVVDWQYDSDPSLPDPDVQDYDHRHVLRTTVNGTWGVPLITGSAAAGDTLTLTYADFPVNAAWDPAHCALVAYAYNTASYEVMQAEERTFQP
ncbi:MAG: Omp28-related outer membrane protein [Flavobacteriales bacterium]|nr:Omp28-related outer membrane protein [Flavobacteriales bacterium]